MAWEFEDYANAAMVVVGVAMMGKSFYDNYKLHQLHLAREAADTYVDECKARMYAMNKFILKQNGSKAAYIEAFTAAKNVIQFDVEVDLKGNPYNADVVTTVNEYIDTLISKAK